jgi:hypothetical protein
MAKRLCALFLIAAAGSANAGQDADRWTGLFFLSAGKAVSTDQADSFALKVQASRRQGVGDLRLKADFFHSKQSKGGGPSETTENRWSTEAWYDYSLGDNHFGYVRGRLDHDGIGGLDLRRIIGVGLGHTIKRSDNVEETGKFSQAGDTEWKLSYGFTHVHREYSDGLGSSSSIAVEAGSAFRKRLTETLMLRHDLVWLPSIEEFTDYVISSDLGLSIDVSQSWEVQFAWLYDYDGGAVAGARKDRYKYTLGVGYRF